MPLTPSMRGRVSAKLTAKPPLTGPAAPVAVDPDVDERFRRPVDDAGSARS